MSATRDHQSGGHDHRGCHSSSATRDAPVICLGCRKRVRRKGRTQKYCSRRCRQRAYWGRRALAKISAVVTHHDTRHFTTPQKSSSKVNELGRQKSQRTGFGKAPLNLLGGGSWSWPGAPKLDPVVRQKIISAEIVGRKALP